MRTPLWRLDELIAAIGGRPVGPDAGTITGLSIDSRTIEEGDAFLAIQGERFDGHDYVGPALAYGASVAIVGQGKLARLGKITGPLLVVDNVTAALRDLAVAARRRTDAKVIAVTGSAGKTTTKDMLRLALASSGAVHSAPASFNNHWGVPLTLARMPQSAAYGVIEIGMNHPGEITDLVGLVRPHAAIITTVAAGHLSAFASVEEIARAKAEIVTGVVPGGAVVLNRDNRHFELLAALAREAGVTRIISFGEDAEADVRLEDAQLGPAGSEVQAQIGGRRIRYGLSVPGAHIVANSLAVLAAVEAVGADVEAAAAALGAFTAGAGRGERVLLRLDEGSALMIDESYNANPASMEAALAALGRAMPRGGRRIAVLGDMLELGESEAELHIGLAEPIHRASVDRVYLVGRRMQTLWDVLPPDRRGVYAETASDLALVLAEELGPGDVVMIKGSNGVRMRDVVGALKERYGQSGEDRRGA